MPSNITIIDDLIAITIKYPVINIGIIIGILLTLYLLFKTVSKFKGKSTIERIGLTILSYITLFIPFIAGAIGGLFVVSNKEEILQVFIKVITEFFLITYIIAIATVIVVIIFSVAKNHIDNKYNR